jgi:hypothetical protein
LRSGQPCAKPPASTRYVTRRRSRSACALELGAKNLQPGSAQLVGVPATSGRNRGETPCSRPNNPARIYKSARRGVSPGSPQKPDTRRRQLGLPGPPSELRFMGLAKRSRSLSLSAHRRCEGPGMDEYHSRLQLDALGERLRRGEPTRADIERLDAYRRAFRPALDQVLEVLRTCPRSPMAHG